MALSLISRRNRHRLGPRYHSRGIDLSGNVSNYVETEQVLTVLSSGDVTSFVQIRGSMPFFWRQKINLRYQPERLIDRHLPSVSISFFQVLYKKMFFLKKKPRQMLFALTVLN